MEGKTERLYIRVTPAEKKRINGLARHCGLSQSEYIRKRALGYEPRPALGEDFEECYYRLCELCNRELSEDTEAELLYLIDDIREQLILPGRQGRREVASWQQQASGPSRDS